MHKIYLESFLGSVCITWSHLGLEKIDIATAQESSEPPSQEAQLPIWLSDFCAALKLYLERGEPIQRLPPINDAHWTAFQKQIYLQLFATRLGETLTYGELAARCLRPKAARSVGAAMSRNRLPLLIPCHRVLPAGGHLGNYSGGEGPLSKKKLLNFEAKFCN